MKTLDKIINAVTCNGMRELEEERCRQIAEEYALAKVNQARREERGKIKSEMENLKFTAEDMAVFADWYSMNWDLDFKPDAALEQWLEERRKSSK